MIWAPIIAISAFLIATVCMTWEIVRHDKK